MRKIIILMLAFMMLAGTAVAKDMLVVIKTNQGKITLKMLPMVAPKTVENFTTHVKNGYYDGIAFHRVIKNFMIQGGDPSETGRGGKSIWGKPFKDEFHPNYTFDKPGIIAMANSGPATNGSQFFITTVPTPWLTNKHTIFGYVVDGYDVVDRIQNVRTGMGDRPISDQKIIKAYMKK